MISILPSVCLSGLKPEMAFAMNVIARAYESVGADCVITSVCDGRHRRNSLHYVGFACDFRVRNLTNEQVKKLQELLPDAKSGKTGVLGAQYDIIWTISGNSPHLHVEYQPKTPRNQ